MTTTAITVVAYMIFSALSLDSWMPRRFWRKKYTVTATASTTEPQRTNNSPGCPGSVWSRPHALWVAGANRKMNCPIRPMMYCPAETPDVGPVNT